MTLYILRHSKMNTSAVSDAQQSIHHGDLVRFSRKRTHDAADAGWEIHRVGIPHNLARHPSFARVRHLRAPFPERLSGDSARQEIERARQRSWHRVLRKTGLALLCYKMYTLISISLAQALVMPYVEVDEPPPDVFLATA